jgi:hypothetical protein
MRAQRTQAKASKPAFNPWVPPTLDIDKQLFDGRYMPPHCKVERRIVWNLLTGLEAAGFHVLAVNDGDGEDKTATIIEAMELVFNLDDCWVFVKKGHYGNHAIRLVLGNGVDCVSDWSFHKDDNDGFNAWMEGFKPETWE